MKMADVLKLNIKPAHRGTHVSKAAIALPVSRMENQLLCVAMGPVMQASQPRVAVKIVQILVVGLAALTAVNQARALPVGQRLDPRMIVSCAVAML
jgi:hypothetical protein